MCVFPPLLPYNCKKVVTVNETFPGKKKKVGGWVGNGQKGSTFHLIACSLTALSYL